MTIEESAKKYANWIIYGGLAAIILFVYGDNKIFSYDVNKMVIYGVCIALGLLFNMLHKDIVAKMGECQILEQRIQYMSQPRQQQQAPIQRPRVQTPFEQDLPNQWGERK